MSKAKERNVETIKVWERGQVTIPTKIRNKLGIETNAILQVKIVPEGILLSPERYTLRDIQRIFETERKKRGITIKEMLDQLDEDEE